MEPNLIIARSEDTTVGNELKVSLFSYVVARDFGFAPNPFYGYCTLATCKPLIRAHANIGDWILGTGSKTKSRQGRAVFAMRVTEILTYNQYWNDPRFIDKRPRLRASIKQAFGDNIYHRGPQSGDWNQCDSHHSWTDGTANRNNVARDTRADRVLISDDFVYWGGEGPVIPLFDNVNVCFRRGHKKRFNESTVAEFVNWISDVDERGFVGAPLDWD